MWTLLGAAWAAPPLIPDGGCACFVGETHGNDTVDAGFRLCRDGPAVSGGFDWTGRRSGRSFRVLEGTLGASGLALHDTAIPLDRPAGGWRFCTIDRYDLSPTDDGGWTGTYDSTACRDHATVTLRPSVCPDTRPRPEVTEQVRGPRPELVPDEVQGCRDRGYLWLSDPDWYERTEIRTAQGWTPVWQVLDRQGGRLGYLLVYEGSCRVVVGIASASDPATLDVRPPDGSTVDAHELSMIRRMAGLGP